MKKKNLFLLLALSTALVFSGCSKEEEEEKPADSGEQPVIQLQTDDQAPAVEVTGEAVEEETRDGMYRSELTNEWIDVSLKDQRPIAAMVDNEKTALPHFGLSQSDVVYEMTNSTANDGVTRFMVLFKDYNSVKQIGSIRSTRPTNLQIIPEWNYYQHEYFP